MGIKTDGKLGRTKRKVSVVSNEGKREEEDHDSRRRHGGMEGEHLWRGESGIIVFGGGSGCSGRGCLFWILLSVVLSVILTVLANLFIYLLSSPAPGI